MEYRLKRHITNTLLYAAIITALIAIIRKYTVAGAILFAIISVTLLAIDRLVENRHLQEKKGKEHAA